MFINYLKIAFRQLLGKKVFSFINITGLAIGFACTAVIFLWVKDELSFDDFHKHKDQIYRVLIKVEGLDAVGLDGELAVTPGKLTGAIKSEIPEIKYVARLFKQFSNPFKYKENTFYEDKYFLVDSDFLKMFSFPIIKGNVTEQLKNPNDIIISQRIARKYFGDENPIGKILKKNNLYEFNVSGVMENMPANSHLKIDIIQSHALLEKYWKDGYNWSNTIHETYIMVQKGSDIPVVTEKINTILNENNTIKGITWFVRLQPLNEIYLNPKVTHSSAITSDRTYINIFSIIAMGILLIACINFVNISTANSISRSKEIGVRKVLGSGRKNLIKQFMSEFVILTFIAALLSLLILEITLPYFNHFTGKELSLNPGFFIAFSVIVILTALFGGSYPAFYLSAYSPERILKNTFAGKKNSISLRSALVVFQFSISILLIISTILVNNQLSFIQNKKLGFEKDNVLYIPATGELGEKFEDTKNQFLQYPNITSISMKGSAPTVTVAGGYVTWSEHEKENFSVRNMRVTPDYFKTMSIEKKSGRLFSKELTTDQNTFILNEAAVKFLGIKSPIGKIIRTFGRKGKIIGIVNDTHFKSLHHQLEPLIFMPLNNYSIGNSGTIIIKFSGNDISKVLSNIKSIWKEYNPNLPFEYHFLDQKIEQQYGFEQRLSKIFTGFSLLAIFISCLGLYSLITFVAVNRTKEIGVRKVMGASVSVIVMSLSKDFIKWALIANIISWPIAWYAMDKWLQGFAYRIDITILPFIIAAVLALLIALLTVSYRSVKAATANPVEALRYE